MRTIFCGILMFVYWSACYTLTNTLKEERLILVAFVVTLVISMVTATVMLVKAKQKNGD